MENKHADLGSTLGRLMWGTVLAKKGFRDNEARAEQEEQNAQEAAVIRAMREQGIMNAISATRRSRVPFIVGAGVPMSGGMLSDFALGGSVAPSGPMMMQGDDVPLGVGDGMVRIASALNKTACMMAEQDVELYKNAAGWPAFKSFGVKALDSVKKTLRGAPRVSSLGNPAPTVPMPKTPAATAGMPQPKVNPPTQTTAAKVQSPTPAAAAPEPKPAASGLSTKSKLLIGGGAALVGGGAYTGVKKTLGVLGNEGHEDGSMRWGSPAGTAPHAVNQYGYPQF